MNALHRCLPILCLSLLVAFSSTNSFAVEGSGEKNGSTTKQGSERKQGPAAKAEPKLKEGFVSLFNGKNLDGWIRRGGEAEYTIEGNAIVGTSKQDTPNTFLCTPREYADFVLEVELKVDNELNSGIQIRSHSRDENGHDHVYGYQVEVDPSDRSFSGGIYDEGGRGWLNDLAGDKNKAAREAFKRGEWNKYRIEAIGPSIKTWVNGVPAADMTDDRDASGFIGLQVHSVGKEHVGKQVRWRNIHLSEVK